MSSFRNAMAVAKDAHEGQKYGDLPYYVAHVLGVVRVCGQELGYEDDTTLAIAALHDVLEDSDYVYEDLLQGFGVLIADAVKTLTRERGVDYFDYIENIKNSNFHTRVVKVADSAYNLRCSLAAPKTDKAAQRRVKKYKRVLAALATDQELDTLGFNEIAQERKG